MTGCRDLRPELGGYVLGALEPDEAAEVREHIDRCAKCASEHASLHGAAGPARSRPGSTPEPLAPSTEEALLDRVAREPARRSPRPARAAAAAIGARRARASRWPRAWLARRDRGRRRRVVTRDDDAAALEPATRSRSSGPPRRPAHAGPALERVPAAPSCACG